MIPLNRQPLPPTLLIFGMACRTLDIDGLKHGCHVGHLTYDVWWLSCHNIAVSLVLNLEHVIVRALLTLRLMRLIQKGR